MTLARLRSWPWLLALGGVLVVGLFCYVNGRLYLAGHAAVRESIASREAMSDTLSLLKDAETGGRGFLLTADPGFLEPYESARSRLERDLDALERLSARDDVQRAEAAQVAILAREKLDVLNALVRDAPDRPAIAPGTISTLQHGKVVMDAIRVEIARMRAREDLRLRERERVVASAAFRLQCVVAAAILGGFLLALAGLSSARTDAARARKTTAQLAEDVAARVRAELELRDQKQLLESVLANIGDSVLVLSADRTVMAVNPALQKVMPYHVGMVLSVEWSRRNVETFLPDGVTPFPPEQGPLTRALRDGLSSDGVEMMIRVPSGELRTFDVTTRPMVLDGRIHAAVAVFHDLTELRAATKLQQENEQRYRILSESSFEGVALTREGRIVDTNANFAHWLGYEPTNLVGMEGISFFDPAERERVLELALNSELHYESRMQRRDGTTFPVEVRGRFAEFRGSKVRIAVIRDVTEKKAHEAKLMAQAEQLRALSLRDELTGLHNRRGFTEAAEHQLKASVRAGEACTVFFADLNGMKLINDQLGHETGDHALRSATDILLGAFRASDVVARLGGDEFAIFAGDCGHGGVAVAIATIESAVAEFNADAANPYRLSISTGSAVNDPENPRDLATLMQEADGNMYAAKRLRHQRQSLRVRAG